jgi:hypothetical protein
MAETTRTARTDQLRPGDRVVLGAGWPLLGAGIVRTVERVEPYEWQWLDGDPVILAVRYREGSTAQWSAANTAVAEQVWTITG